VCFDSYRSDCGSVEVILIDCGALGECRIDIEAPLCCRIFVRKCSPNLSVIMAPKMKLPSKGGKGSKTPTPKRKVVPEYKLNRNFDERLETFAEKKMWPERGIDLESLRDTPVPATVNDMGWGGLAATPPHYSESLVKEFYAGMNPGEYC
jgi:hypothetical protein